MYSLRLPTGELVPLVDPQDQVEIARKTATLGGHFNYYQKDFADRNVSASRGASVAKYAAAARQG